MITWKFELEKQKEYYDTFKKQLEKNIYQDLKYYVLPTMPEKFRGRVIFLPMVCEPQKIFVKQKIKNTWHECHGFTPSVAYFPLGF